MACSRGVCRLRSEGDDGDAMGHLSPKKSDSNSIAPQLMNYLCLILLYLCFALVGNANGLCIGSNAASTASTN